MKINTERQLRLINGEEINLTLTYGSLNRLMAKEPTLVDDYFAIQAKIEPLNDLEIAKILYVAYRCASNTERTLTYEEFLDLMPSNRDTIYGLYANLMYPKNESSPSHFEGER